VALFQSREKREDNTEPFLDHVVSMTSDNANISYTGIKAIKNSDVFTGVRILGSDIASSPLQITRDNQVLNDGRITELLNTKPNDKMNGWHFKFALMVNMLLNGNSFAEIIRSGNKQIKQLELIKNSLVSMKQRKNGSVYYEIENEDKSKRIVEQDNILHFKYFTQDGLTGISPLYSLADEMKVQKAGNKTIHNFFSRGINSSGILKVNKSDLNAEAKNAIREKFEEANGSDEGNNSLRTIILDEAMDYQNLEVNTDVLKLINSSDWTTKQIAKAFGIPSERLGVESHHSNTTQTNVMYLQNTLVHYYRSFTSELDNKLSYQFKFNSEFLFEADPETMTETIVNQVESGLITRNEGRAKLGYKPVSGGDELIYFKRRNTNNGNETSNNGRIES